MDTARACAIPAGVQRDVLRHRGFKIVPLAKTLRVFIPSAEIHALGGGRGGLLRASALLHRLRRYADRLAVAVKRHGIAACFRASDEKRQNAGKQHR